MRLGGAMTSLILPKLIRSGARDGIVFSRLAGNPPALVQYVTTQGKRPAFAGNLPGLTIQFRSDVSRKIFRLLYRDFGAGFFQLFPGGVGVRLVGAFEHGLGSA